MPRNPSTGVYSPPANTIAIPNTTITSVMFNDLRNDIVSTFNVVLPPSLGGTGSSSLAGLLATIGGLPLAGGTLTGPLNLSGNASAALQSVPKQQLDAEIATRAPLAHVQAASTITDFAAAADARIAAASINDLANVTLNSPVDGHTLRYSGSGFINNPFYTEYNMGVFQPGVRKVQAHGLGYTPSHFECWLRCNTADNEWAVGDMIPIQSMQYSGAFYYPIYMNATEVGLSPRVGVLIYATQKASLGDGAVLTQARWDVVFRVFP